MSQQNKKNNEQKAIILATILFVSGIVFISTSSLWSLTKLFRMKDKSSVSLETVAANTPSVPTISQDNTKVDSTSTVNIMSASLPESKEPAILFKDKQVRRVSLDIERTVVLRGEIGENALAAAEAIKTLASVSSKPIYLILSGPGGSVMTGGILIGAIQSSAAPVYTICDVLCASMDSMIHQYGKLRFMTDRTIIMFHPASAGAQGEVDKMYSMVAFLKRYTNKMETEVAARQLLSFGQYKQKISTELWLDAEDALSSRVTDGIISYVVPRPFAIDIPNRQEQNKKQAKTNPTSDVQWICTTGYCKDIKWTTSK